MGHSINAVLLKGTFDAERARSFDLTPIPLMAEITMFPLKDRFCDHWSEKLGVSGWVSDERPFLNSNLTHLMVSSIAHEPLFAVIDTSYFMGRGSQAAAVYRGRTEIMPPKWSKEGSVAETTGPINEALRLLGIGPHIEVTGRIRETLLWLGIVARKQWDEFDTVGLGQYRNFDDLFEMYEDDD